MTISNNYPESTGPNDPNAPWNEKINIDSDNNNEACINCHFFSVSRGYCSQHGEIIDFPYDKNCNDWQ